MAILDTIGLESNKLFKINLVLVRKWGDSPF